MGNTMEQKLDEEIERRFDRLAAMGAESPGCKEEAEVLEGLCRLKTETAKTKEGRWMQIAKIVVDGAAVVLPLAFYGLWMKRGFEFEKTGSFTSSVFRGLFSKFRPTK